MAKAVTVSMVKVPVIVSPAFKTLADILLVLVATFPAIVVVSVLISLISVIYPAKE